MLPVDERSSPLQRRERPLVSEVPKLMSLSTIATIVGAHAKTAAAVLAVSAATGGGLAVATTVANSHAVPGLAIASAAPNAQSAQTTDSVDATDTTTTAPDVTPTASSSPVTCDSAKNHGEYVSSVAHATPPGPGHGKAVSAAAQSSCGKSAADDADDSAAGDSDATDSTDTDTDTDDSDSADDGGKPTTLPSHAAHPKHSGHQPGH
jgi:hypothetical protein